LPAELRVASFLAPRLEGLYRSVAEAIGGELVQARSFEDLVTGEIDLAFLCGLPYTRLEGDVEALVAPVPSGDRYGGRAVYFSDVIVRPGDPAGSIAGLRGRRFAFNEEGSHSGYNAVTAEMDFGDFGTAIEVGSHVAAIAAVRTGEADGAAIDSHLLDLLGHDALRVIQSLGPWPEKPLAAGPSVSGERRAEIRERVAALAGSPDFRVDRWAPVSDADYDPIRRLEARSRARSSAA
jgi:phosphonate transport system substrate-binding protein